MPRALALTFDDGPWLGGTDRVIELLSEHAIQATFFVWGQQVLAHPELVRAALLTGHSIQPHCFSHSTSYRRMTSAEIRCDLEGVLALLLELGAPTPRLWRPPWGEWQPGVNDALAREHGLELTGWSIDSGDWDGHPAEAMHARVSSVLEQTPSSETPVLLLHDCPLERGQWRRRQHVDETIELVRMLLADRDLVLGPQTEAVPDGLEPRP